MNKYNRVMMETAKIWSKESYCKLRKVGAVIAKDNRIISIGYNGTPAKTNNDCENKVLICNRCLTIKKYKKDKVKTKHKKCGGKLLIFIKDTKNTVIHAEENALKFAKKENINVEGASIYITKAPCRNCAELIIKAKIKKVIYRDNITDKSGLELLEKKKIKIETYTND